MFLSLVFHNHQPVGQLPWSFEDAWRDSYAPFLDVLQQHPKIKVALHYTGPLLDWLEENRPTTLEQIRLLVDRGQVEILGGGYYEPILAIWPHHDKLAQLRKLHHRVLELFRLEPRGMWLAERIWEPSLIAPIREAGYHYTFIDSTVFQTAGLVEDDLFTTFAAVGPNNVANDSLTVFPINQHLRHHIPWHPSEESLEYLRKIHEEQGEESLAVFADDGEKFGAWPGTHKYVFGQGWLDDFFTMLEENDDWLHTVIPSEWCGTRGAAGTVDLPCGSYSEMQEWSGGNWRNFLALYPESHDIYQEVLRTGTLVKSHDIMDAAYDHVLQAQCNDAYWHGSFGGLYLRHLRQAIYTQTIAAQVLVDGCAPFIRVSHTETGDIFLENEQVAVGVRSRGGHIFNWSSKGSRHNVLSTLRRKSEKYHDETAPIDWYPRAALLDHFMGSETTPANFAQVRFDERGDFASEAWEMTTEYSASEATVSLQRHGGVWQDNRHLLVCLTKKLTLRIGVGTLGVEYSLRNQSDSIIQLWWGNEWNVALSGIDLPVRHYHAGDHRIQNYLGHNRTFENVSLVYADDGWLQLTSEWRFSRPLDVWHVPIWSTSQKEGGSIEKTHQSSAFIFHQRLQLEPGEECTFNFWASLLSKRL